VRFSAGDGLRFTCSYNNDTPNAITFGSHADTQEHCNLVVDYSRPDEPLGIAAFDPRALCADGGGAW
jgi:hypothetical protein